MTKLRIMSNNIWWCDSNTPAWEAIGADCSAIHRGPELFRMYQETAPDIIGLQECSARMSHQLMAAFTMNHAPYAFLWGRDTPIIYRKDLFELVDSEVCIYPEEIPGLEGSFNNLKTKSYCAAALRLKETGKLLIFATTHLWYKSDNPKSRSYQPGSEKARAWQMGHLIDKLDHLQAQYGCPAVIVGDLNTWPAGAAVQTALARDFVHAHDAATEHADETTGMHYCCQEGYDSMIEDGGFAKSIDHILIRGNLPVHRYERYFAESYMPLSDHCPLWIDTEI